MKLFIWIIHPLTCADYQHVFASVCVSFAGRLFGTGSRRDMRKLFDVITTCPFLLPLAVILAKCCLTASLVTGNSFYCNVKPPEAMLTTRLKVVMNRRVLKVAFD